jgi:hypothetical protein
MLTILLTLPGCVTTMTVKPVTTNKEPEGVRYYLPKPLLMVTPQNDGTAKFEWIYVPDGTAQYAVKTSAYLAKHSTSVEIDESGFLKKLSWNGTPTELAGTTLETAADIRKAQIERAAADEKAERVDAEAAQKKLDDAIAAARARVQELDDTIAMTEREVAILESEVATGTAPKEKFAEKLVDAKVRLQRAEAERTRAVQALNELLSSVAAGAKGAALGGGKADKPPQYSQAWGPVFFEIVEDPDTKNVSLRRYAAQQPFSTWKKASKPPAKPKFAYKDSNVAKRVASTKQFEVRFVPSVPIHSLAEGAILRKGTTVMNAQMIGGGPVLAGDTVVLSLKPDTTPGQYSLTILYKLTSDSPAESGTVTFEVL